MMFPQLALYKSDGNFDKPVRNITRTCASANRSICASRYPREGEVAEIRGRRYKQEGNLMSCGVVL